VFFAQVCRGMTIFTTTGGIALNSNAFGVP